MPSFRPGLHITPNLGSDIFRYQPLERREVLLGDSFDLAHILNVSKLHVCYERQHFMQLKACLHDLKFVNFPFCNLTARTASVIRPCQCSHLSVLNIGNFYLGNDHIIIFSILVFSQLAGEPCIPSKPLLPVGHKLSTKIVSLR